MKKILMSLCLLSVSSCAFAYVEEGKSADVERLYRQNYSESTLRVVDKHRSKITGDDQIYNVRYQHPDTNDKQLTKWYKKAKYYVDPASDDGHFGEREIEFNNKFYEYDPIKKTIPTPVDTYL